VNVSTYDSVRMQLSLGPKQQYDTLIENKKVHRTMAAVSKK